MNEATTNEGTKTTNEATTKERKQRMNEATTKEGTKTTNEATTKQQRRNIEHRTSNIEHRRRQQLAAGSWQSVSPSVTVSE